MISRSKKQRFILLSELRRHFQHLSIHFDLVVTPTRDRNGKRTGETQDLEVFLSHPLYMEQDRVRWHTSFMTCLDDFTTDQEIIQEISRLVEGHINAKKPSTARASAHGALADIIID